MSMLLITVGRLRNGGMAALERYGEGVTVVGDDSGRPDLVAFIRFPNADAIHQFLESAEYRMQVPHRDEAFVELHSYIAADLREEP